MSGSQMAKAKEDAAAIMKQKQAACMPRPQATRLSASTYHLPLYTAEAKKAAETAAAKK